MVILCLQRKIPTSAFAVESFFGRLPRNDNKYVLLIDADPQCNATSYLLNEEQLESLYEHEKGETIESLVEPLRKGKGYYSGNFQLSKSPRFNIDVMPGDPRLALSEDLLA